MVRGSVSVHHHQFDLGECHGVKEQFFIENNLYMKKMLFKLLHCIVKEYEIFNELFFLQSKLTHERDVVKCLKLVHCIVCIVKEYGIFNELSFLPRKLTLFETSFKKVVSLFPLASASRKSKARRKTKICDLISR